MQIAKDGSVVTLYWHRRLYDTRGNANPNARRWHNFQKLRLDMQRHCAAVDIANWRQLLTHISNRNDRAICSTITNIVDRAKQYHQSCTDHLEVKLQFCFLYCFQCIIIFSQNKSCDDDDERSLQRVRVMLSRFHSLATRYAAAFSTDCYCWCIIKTLRCVYQSVYKCCISVLHCILIVSVITPMSAILTRCHICRLQMWHLVKIADIGVITDTIIQLPWSLRSHH